MAKVIRVEDFEQEGRQRHRYFYLCDICGQEHSKLQRFGEDRESLCKACADKRNGIKREAWKKRNRQAHHLFNPSCKKKRTRPPKIRPEVEIDEDGYINAICCFCRKDFYRTTEWVYKYSLYDKTLNYCCSYTCLQAYRAVWDSPQEELPYEA